MSRNRRFMNAQTISFNVIVEQNDSSLNQEKEDGELITNAMLSPRENRRLHSSERTCFYFLQLPNLRWNKAWESICSRFRKKFFQFELFKKSAVSVDFHWQIRNFAYYWKYSFDFQANLESVLWFFLHSSTIPCYKFIYFDFIKYLEHYSLIIEEWSFTFCKFFN